MTQYVIPWMTEIFVPLLGRKLITHAYPSMHGSCIQLPAGLLDQLDVVKTIKLTTDFDTYVGVDQVSLEITLPKIGLKTVVFNVMPFLNNCEMTLGRSALQGFVIAP